LFGLSTTGDYSVSRSPSPRRSSLFTTESFSGSQHRSNSSQVGVSFFAFIKFQLFPKEETLVVPVPTSFAQRSITPGNSPPSKQPLAPTPPPTQPLPLTPPAPNQHLPSTPPPAQTLASTPPSKLSSYLPAQPSVPASTQEQKDVLGNWFLANAHVLPSNLTYHSFMANPSRFAPPELLTNSAAVVEVEFVETTTDHPPENVTEPQSIEWFEGPPVKEG